MGGPRLVGVVGPGLLSLKIYPCYVIQLYELFHTVVAAISVVFLCHRVELATVILFYGYIFNKLLLCIQGGA